MLIQALYKASKFYKIDVLVKSDLFRGGGIFAESNSKKHPHCHFERQREIFNQSRFLVAFASRNDRELSFWSINIYFQVT